jgi:hypothetical protein
MLRAHGVVTPPQGHWNRVYAGKRVLSPVKPPPRRPGETGLLRADARFVGHVPASVPLSADGPFASAEVPEDLGDLRARVLAGMRKVTVPRDLSSPHPGLRDVLKREARRVEKLAASGWQWDAPLFASPYWQRQLRFWNALFRGLSPWGTGGLREDDRRLEASAVIGESHVALSLGPVGKVSLEHFGGQSRPSSDTPARTPLVLLIGTVKSTVATFSDDAGNRLEDWLREIVGAVVTAGEARFRTSLREQEAWVEQQRTWEAQERRRRLEREEQARVERLLVHAAALREADDIRTLVARVENSGGKAAAAWSAWALARADQLDPLVSGNIYAEFEPIVSDLNGV